jgi:hypothetical protein
MSRTSRIQVSAFFDRKIVDLGIALLLSAVFLWMSFQLDPRLGYYLRIPAFAASVRIFPAGIHAGPELGIVANCGTIALLAMPIYGALRMGVCWRKRHRD